MSSPCLQVGAAVRRHVVVFECKHGEKERGGLGHFLLLSPARGNISWLRQERSPSPHIIAPGEGPFNFIVGEEATPRFAPAEDQTPSDQHDPQLCSHGNQTLPPGHTFCRDAKLRRIPSRDNI
ncbi:hypothetical protein KUCAC02_019284 [Chaenocephalus aceratus]|nr:hypothetical protein KUCAC02_019284 [Chaenocephalus aceratus]